MNKWITSISIVLASYTVLICVPSLVYAKKGVRQQIQLKAGAALQRIKSDSETVVRARWHPDRGTVRSLYNLTLPAPIGTRETSARQCLSDYCDLFAMTDPNIELRLINIQGSLTGTHARFHQYYNGIEVYGAAISIHTNHSGQIRVIHSNYFPQINISAAASFSPDQAIAIAESGAFNLRKSSRADLVIFPNRDAGRLGDYTDAYRLAYRAIIHSTQPVVSWEYIIDANTGEPLQRRNLLRFADGRGRVFNPNPVVALKDFTLMDQGDSADAIPEAAYTDVILLELDGSGFLDGPYVSTKLTENRVNEPTLEFNYLRDDPGFEEVMVYYHIDTVGRYLKGLGFDFVDDWQIPANVHFGVTRAGFYDPSDGSINFGDAGVDVAEDAEVIIHEYGHAILERQVPNMNKGEGGAIHEGFSDFLAASFFSAVSDGFGDFIVFEWAGSDDPEVATRSVNSNKRYPQDIVGQPHADGQIWSAALWEIFEAIGRDASIRLVIESHFFLSPGAEFVDGASAILMADQELNGGVNFDFILGIMENRGFFTPPRLASDAFEENDTAETAASIELPFVSEGLSIHTADDDDYYKFHLAETMQVGLGIEFQPIYGELMLTLTGPNDAALVAFETKDITSLELVPGDYLVAVSGINGATNDYKLVLIIDNHGDTPDTATPVAIGDTIEGFIDFSGDTDFFAFEGEEGQRVEITVTTKNSDLDSLLVIYGPDGELFAKSDDVLPTIGPEPIPELNPRGIDSRVSEKLPTDGTYLLAVSNIALPNLNAPFGGLNYSYTLTIGGKTDDHAACGSGEETPLTFDEPITGIITLSGDPASPDPHDSDGFRFEASAGTVVALRVEIEMPNREVIFWATQLSLLDASGETLVSTRGNPNGLRVGIDGFLIPADGEYCVDIAGFIGGAVGSTYTYTLTLSEGELPEDDHEGLRGNPTPLAVGEPVGGAISFAGDADAFQFTATAGQLITLSVDGQPAGPFFGFALTLYNNDLQILMEVPLFIQGPDSALEGFEIPVGGTYYAEIKDIAGGSEANLIYTLTLTIEEGDGAGRFPPYDVNQDGKVDIFDLVLVGQHFGEKYINATPTADFGQLRSTLPEGKLRLLMTPSATDTRKLTVSIDTTAISDLYGYHFLIQYDPAVLELLTASPSPVLAGELPQSYWHISQQGTQLNFTQTRQGTLQGVTAEGALAMLVFDVKKTASPLLQSPIQLVDLQLADSLTRAIPVEVVGQQVSMRELFPEKPMLLQNYPNPFNPETWIPYQLSTDSEVVISIYDTQGERVRQLDLGYQHVGTYVTRGRAAHWDGEDMYGEPVASGLYFYQIQAGAFSASRKMVILK